MAGVIGAVARVVFAAVVLAMTVAGTVLRPFSRFPGRAMADMGAMIDCCCVEAAQSTA